MPARFSSATIVGRERELARLAEALEATVDGGHRRRRWARGEPADRRGGAPDRGPAGAARRRCGPGRSGDPYAPVVAGLETLIAGFDDRELARVAGIGAEELAKLLPATVDRSGSDSSRSGRP